MYFYIDIVRSIAMFQIHYLFQRVYMFVCFVDILTCKTTTPLLIFKL